jgi:3-hydroxyacyl-CoA dehydrogenase
MAGEIKKVAVIGSGVMGSQIAAHITNAGVPVLLLDIVLKDQPDRNFLAKTAIEKLAKMDPAPFMHAKNARLITAGNLEDDLAKLSDVDWVIEAVLENPQVKSDLYKKVDGVRKPGSIISSNTSTIPLNVLTGGQSEHFARDFLITHFFNPPRYMKLLELVTGPKTHAGAADTIRDFCDRNLGKGVVACKDTPGFIANRLGVFFIQCAVNAAFDLGLTVEEADAVFSKPTGMPKTGVFGLLDLIGLDLMPLIAKSFLATLPADDAYRAVNVAHPLIDKMIADGYTGRKGKGGFYRLNKSEGGKVKESVDLKTGAYRASEKVKLATVEAAGKNLRALCEAQDKIGKFAWTVLSQALSYAAALVPQIADDIVAVDAGMRLGFNWKFGPFELIDQLGAGWFAERLKAEGKTVPEFLQKAAAKSFYRVEDGKLQFLAVNGGIRMSCARRVCCCWPMSSAPPASLLPRMAPPACGMSATACCVLNFTPR